MEINDKLKPLVDVPDSNGWYPLHAASARGDVQGVRLLLESGASINVQTDNGQTPLHYAVSKGHLEIVKLLLPNADLSVVDRNG